MSGSDPPERRRWDGNYDRLPYELDEVDGGEAVQLLYENGNGNECAVRAEVGEIAAYNSWLLLFDSDGSGDMHIVRPDGVVLLETYPDDQINEIGTCIEVRSLHTDNEQ